MWLVLFAGCDLFAEPAAVDWQITPGNLGEARVAGSGFSTTDGEGLGAAFPQLMPGWGDGFPAWDVPNAIWEIAQHELVADEGACPYVELDGADQTFRSDCRSKDGYEWEGTVGQKDWEEAGVEYTRLDFDLTVTADVDGARFDSLSLHGAIQRGTTESEEHVDVNLEAELLGYYEARQQPDDARIPTWAAWGASGSAEAGDGALGIDLAADVGGTKGFRLTGAALTTSSSCPVEPGGTAELAEGVSAEFQGADGCDACATIVTADGETEACAPD